MEEEKTNDDEIKVILVGDSGVGKTCLINITIGIPFNENEKSSSASSFSKKKININKKQYIINLWDTMGQERLRYLTQLFFNNAKIVIFVYDIAVKKSFESLPGWVKDVEEKLGDNIVKGVVANKSDLYLEQQVNDDEGREYAKNIGASFLTISAKVDDPKKFEDFMVELAREYLFKGEKTDDKKFQLNGENGAKPKKKKCC